MMISRAVLVLLAVTSGLSSWDLQADTVTWVGGDADWDGSAARWNSADEPDADDEAIISTPNLVQLANPVESVAGLTLSQGAEFMTHGNSMLVSGLVSVAGADTTLAVSENSNVAFGNMLIGSGSQLFMQGGVVGPGGTLSVSAMGNIYGYGLITAPVHNSGVITAAGGQLIFTNATFITDQFTKEDELRVEPNSTLEIRGDLDDTSLFGDRFDGKITVDSGTLFINGHSIQNAFGHLSVYDLTGGTLMQSAGGAWALDGFMIARAGAASTLKGPGFFRFGSNLGVELDADLQLESYAWIDSGANWSGTGALVVLPGGQLVDRGIVSRVRNEGSFSVASSDGDPTGAAGAGFFEQTSSGKLVVSFGRNSLPAGGRLDVSDAVLDGYLELRLNPGYTPQVGESYTVLSVISPTGGYSGSFDQVIQPENMPPDLMFSVLYGPKDVLVYVVPRAFLASDFNQDGQVDGADLSQWASSFGQNGTSDADDDGDSDGADFLKWQRQAGLSGGTGAASVPEPNNCALGALVAFTVVCRRSLVGPTAGYST
jgi:hypothetical protein